MIRGLALAAPPLDPWRGERLGAQSCGRGVNGGPVEGPGGPCPQEVTDAPWPPSLPSSPKHHIRPAVPELCLL